MKPLVIIPTYDEKENVTPMAEQVLKQDGRIEILFVDDNSPDGTGTIIDGLVANNPRIHVLHRAGKEGLGRAYIAGFRWALERDYTHILQMDCDFSHNPEDLPRFLAAQTDADLVIGSRYVGGIRVLNWPFHRLLLSTGAGVYVRLVTGMPIYDPTGGYKCFHRKVLENINFDTITSNGYSFQIEMNYTAWMQRFRIVELPIVFADRQAGYSKMSFSITFEAMMMVLKLWIRNGLRRSPRKAPQQ